MGSTCPKPMPLTSWSNRSDARLPPAARAANPPCHPPCLCPSPRPIAGPQTPSSDSDRSSDSELFDQLVKQRPIAGPQTPAADPHGPPRHEHVAGAGPFDQLVKQLVKRWSRYEQCRRGWAVRPRQALAPAVDSHARARGTAGPGPPSGPFRTSWSVRPAGQTVVTLPAVRAGLSTVTVTRTARTRSRDARHARKRL